MDLVGGFLLSPLFLWTSETVQNPLILKSNLLYLHGVSQVAALIRSPELLVDILKVPLSNTKLQMNANKKRKIREKRIFNQAKKLKNIFDEEEDGNEVSEYVEEEEINGEEGVDISEENEISEDPMPTNSDTKKLKELKFPDKKDPYFMESVFHQHVINDLKKYFKIISVESQKYAVLKDNAFNGVFPGLENKNSKCKECPKGERKKEKRKGKNKRKKQKEVTKKAQI